MSAGSGGWSSPPAGPVTVAPCGSGSRRYHLIRLYNGLGRISPARYTIPPVNRTRFLLSLPPETLRALDQRRAGTSRTAVVEPLVRGWLGSPGVVAEGVDSRGDWRLAISPTGMAELQRRPGAPPAV